MKNTITIIFMLLSVSLLAQNERIYSPAQIMSIDISKQALEGDLYYDGTSDVLYIGLMDGSLVPINDTDNQSIDVSTFTSSGINLSLLRDGVAPVTIPLISNTAGNALVFDTDGLYVSESDNQTIDVATFTAGALNLSLEDDGAATIDIPLISNTAGNDLSFDTDGLFVNETDDQQLSGFTIDGANELSLTIEDGNTVGVDLSGLVGSDDQTIDVSTHDASGLNLSLEDDGAATVTIPLISTTAGNDLSFDTDGLFVNETDDQQLSGFTIDGANELSLTIEDGNTVGVDLSGLVGSDDQVVDQFEISASDILSISLEDDGASPLTVDLTPYLDADADWHLPLGVNNATDILQSIYTFGNVGININDPQYALHVDAGDPTSAGPWAVIEGGSNVRSNIALQLYDEGTAANNENILEFAFNPNTGSASPLSRIRSNTVGTFHVDGADLTLEAYSAPGTVNASQLVLKNDGNVGVGTAAPAAKLDVDNGSVRFSDYGVGAYAETLPAVDAAEYHLAVDAQGDVIETNTVKASKIFYPPAIVIDVSTVTTGESIDLYQEYVDRFGSPLLASPSSAGAIPTYGRAELDYYVTDLDGTVFTNHSLDDNGVFSYDVASVPAGNCTYINVVFVVK